MKKRLLSLYGLAIWAIALASLYTLLLPRVRFLNQQHLRSIDSFLEYRYQHSEKPDLINKIIIIDIEDISLSKIQQRWPINRDLYAIVLNNLNKNDANKPAVIGIDIAFVGKSDNQLYDTLFAEALNKADNVILGTYFNKNGKLVLPEPALTEAARAVGFVNYPRDPDFSIRRARPFIVNNDHGIEYTFVFKIGSFLGNLDLKKTFYDKKKNSLRLSTFDGELQEITLPLEQKSKTVRLNYFAKFDDFKVIPFWKMLDPNESTEIFKDKIVLIGTAMELLHDIHPTPLGSMPGLCVNANFLTSLLLNRFLLNIPTSANFFIFFILALIISMFTYRYSNLKGLLLSIILAGFGFFISVIYISKDIIFDYYGFLLITLVSFLSIASFKHLCIFIENTRLSKMAITDPLTGLFITRFYELKLNSEIRIAQNEKLALSLVMFEIDKFQDINNSFGYEFGNIVLKEVAASLKRNSRPSDIVSKLEGVRFSVILTRTNVDGAKKYADKIRKIIEETQFNWQEKTVKVTVSAGVSAFSESTSHPQDLHNLATKALTEAMAYGFNRVKALP